MTSARVCMHETFGCVHPSDSGRTPMMADQGTNGQPTWRSRRTLVTEPGMAYGGRPLGQRRRHSSAPMWRKSLYLKGGTTGAMWVKQHLTRSYDRGHLRPKGLRGQEHDAKRLMRLSTNRQEVSQLGRVW